MTTVSTVEEMPKRDTKNDTDLCDVCTSEFASKRYQHYHEESCHCKAKPCCDICGLSVNSDMALMVHKKIHIWEKTVAEKEQLSPVYECSVCDLHTHSPRCLIFHYQDAHPYYDRLSTKSVSRVLYDENQNQIVRYEDDEHEVLEENVKCPLCCVLYGKNRIKGHLMTAHRGDKYVFCTHCAAIIQDPEEMRVHLLEHAREEDLEECNVCEGIFVSAEALVKHRRLHSYQRPFSCSVCQKEFQSKTGAIAHFYSHLKIEMLEDTNREAAPDTDLHA